MNIFKDFFEHYKRHSVPLGPKDIPQDILNDLYRDPLNNEENTQESFKSYDGSFDNATDFMSEFDEMFNSFFRGFPGIAFPLPEGNEILSPQEPWKSPDNQKSLQERMLNNMEKEFIPPAGHPPSPFPFSFHQWRRPQRTNPYDSRMKREDKNLDDDIQKGDKSLDDILPRAGDNQMTQRPSSFFSYFSSSVTRKRDGVIETKKTVRDSSGNEEITITKMIGDKEYTISHKTDQIGTNEKRESVDEDTGQNHFGILTPEKSPINDRRSSVYDRLRSWFVDKND